VVVGIPVQVLALARRSLSRGRTLRLASVLLSTDHVPRAIVSTLERDWDCRVFNHYGATEMGLGGGVECAAHAGLHLREADLLFEVVDPLSGVPLPPGQEGEVVFSTLTREAMPLIRYRTGDLSSFVPGPCPCGSRLRLLSTVRSRRGDVAVLVGGERLRLADLDEALFGVDDVLDFRARLGADGEGEWLAVELLCEGGSAGQGGGGAARQRRAAAALARVPAVAAAGAAGRLRVDVGAAVRPWSSGDGTRKRTIRDERPQETETR